MDDVGFVALLGVGGRDGPGRGAAARDASLVRLLKEAAEPLSDVDTGDVGPTIERIGTSRLVLLGEATHGTSEFYRRRAQLTRELVRRGQVRIVAVEADWPDAAVVNRWVKGLPSRDPEAAFERFPTWMWRNREVADFLGWLRAWNAEHPSAKVGFYGLDLYSLFTSIRAVVGYLERVDPKAAEAARARYACLSPWEGAPELYGRAALAGRIRSCEEDAVSMLERLLARRLERAAEDGSSMLDAVENARLVADAEHYYRAMYRGAAESWNLRDRHMFATLEALLAHHGPGSRAVVWAHNSHLGDASATEMSVRGELDLGQLARETYGEQAYLVGFGTDHGTVRAASDWDEPGEAMDVVPAHAESYEHLCHRTELPAFHLALRDPAREEVAAELGPPRLERAIGVVYRPRTELQSHYFQACLPRQFDEYVWIDETHAVTPLDRDEARAIAADHPFGGAP